MIKRLSQKIHHLLDKAEVPSIPQERMRIFSKLFGLPVYKARAILDGHLKPDGSLLNSIAKEFEIKVSWFNAD